MLSGAQPEPAMRVVADSGGTPPRSGETTSRRSSRKQAQASKASPKKKANCAEQNSGERRWNPFRTKHLLDSVCEVTSFSSDQWDEMLEVGWCVKDAHILDGAGYVLAPWLKKEKRNIRSFKSLTEGKDTGFWM